MSNGTNEPLHVGVARFSGIDGAERAFADAVERDAAARWIPDAAFVEVHTDSRIVVRGSVAGHYVDLDGEGDVIGPATGRGAVVGAAAGLPLGPAALAIGLVAGAIAGGEVEASGVAAPQGAAFEAIRELVPKGASAVVVVSSSEQVGAMSEALAGVAKSFQDHPLSPAAEAQLRSALAAAPPSVRPRRTRSQ